MWGRGDPSPGRRQGQGRALAPKVPVPLAALQQSSPEGETQEAAAETVTVLCQREEGSRGEEFLVCLALGLGLKDGGSPKAQLPQEMKKGGDGDPLPLALEA